MYVTKFTVLRGDRGLTEVTPYDILKAVLGVLHGQTSELVFIKLLKINDPPVIYKKENPNIIVCFCYGLNLPIVLMN